MGASPRLFPNCPNDCGRCEEAVRRVDRVAARFRRGVLTEQELHDELRLAIFEACRDHSPTGRIDDLMLEHVVINLRDRLPAEGQDPFGDDVLGLGPRNSARRIEHDDELRRLSSGERSLSAVGAFLSLWGATAAFGQAIVFTDARWVLEGLFPSRSTDGTARVRLSSWNMQSHLDPGGQIIVGWLRDLARTGDTDAEQLLVACLEQQSPPGRS